MNPQYYNNEIKIKSLILHDLIKSYKDFINMNNDCINDDKKWEEMVTNITNWVKSLKTSIIKILDNNNSYLDFVINDVPTKKHTI